MFYTRKGDDGTSGLFGSKVRFPKTSSVYDALGTVDELNSLLGLCRAKNQGSDQQRSLRLENILIQAQECLFVIQAELAGAEKALTDESVVSLEVDIDTISKQIENPHAFVIPGANELSAQFDFARAVARRAEREVRKAEVQRPISKASTAYLNRLSSLLYVLARYVVHEANLKERSPSY